MKSEIKRIYKEFKKIIMLPEMQVLPGQLAFYIIMSFVPILAICAIIVSHFIESFNLTNLIYTYLPDNLASIIIPFCTSSYGNSAIFFFFAYFFMAINGPKSIIITSNNLYKIKENSVLRITLKSLFMTFVLITLLVFMIFIPILGNVILNYLTKYINIQNYLGIIKFIKVIVTFTFIYLAIKLLYTMAPSKEIKSEETTLGAIFTTVSWVIATEIFSFYITNIAKYNVLYGNFANILILLLWIYLIAYLFVVGMAININKYNLGKEKKL